MVTCPVTIANGVHEIDANAALQLFDRGVYLPVITRVIYNTGTKVLKSHEEEKTYDEVNQKTGETVTKTAKHKVVDESRKVLATIVEFADGSKSAVTNSEHDSASLFDADGNPTREAKEAGFVYAVIKRVLCGQLTENLDGTLGCEMKGFGRILADYVDNAYDCQQAKKDNAAKKAAAAKAHAERLANTKPKLKHASLAEVVDRLSEAVKTLTEKVNS